MKTVSGLVSVFITIPIWFYLLYTILTAIHASDLTWFLYWVYVPFCLFVQIVSKLTESD